MRPDTPIYRLSAALAAAGLLLAPLPDGLRAQPAPSADAAAPVPSADPPARVGWLAEIRGTVSFRGPDADHWDTATPNYPLTSGDALWTEPGASAAIGLGSSRLVLDQATELDIDVLDEHMLSAALARGQVYVESDGLEPGDTLSLRTPRGIVSITQPGRYLIAAGDESVPTQLTVVEGSAQIGAIGLSLLVRAGETASVTGQDRFAAMMSPRQPDPFLDAEARDASIPVTAGIAPPAVVRQMSGAEPLLQSGEWISLPEYGPAWVPPVPADWVPYRAGHWAWVAPWGWTWIDDAPWGFAPFHYGRWLDHDGRWVWLPGEAYARPVYAPALVTWVELGAGAAVGLGLAAAVGWIPLGPREPYRPWFHASPHWTERVNGPRMARIAAPGIASFMNRRAGTMGEPGWVTGERRPGQHWAAMAPQALASARPLTQVPVRPNLGTPGARASTEPRRTAPGPALTPRRLGREGPAAFRPAPRQGLPAVQAPSAGFRPALPALPPGGGGRPSGFMPAGPRPAQNVPGGMPTSPSHGGTVGGPAGFGRPGPAATPRVVQPPHLPSVQSPAAPDRPAAPPRPAGFPGLAAPGFPPPRPAPGFQPQPRPAPASPPQPRPAPTFQPRSAPAFQPHTAPSFQPHAGPALRAAPPPRPAPQQQSGERHEHNRR